jgi:hypothetical protein
VLRKATSSLTADLVPVFDWLRKNGVRKILNVAVLDDQEPSHTDSGIEQALLGFDVEIWNWKQFDLNSDIIFTAAPRVRVLHLYSTGNKAVLMGWASPDGLLKLREVFTKLPNLRYMMRRPTPLTSSRLTTSSADNKSCYSS